MDSSPKNIVVLRCLHYHISTISADDKVINLDDVMATFWHRTGNARNYEFALSLFETELLPFGLEKNSISVTKAKAYLHEVNKITSLINAFEYTITQIMLRGQGDGFDDIRSLEEALMFDADFLSVMEDGAESKLYKEYQPLIAKLNHLSSADALTIMTRMGFERESVTLAPMQAIHSDLDYFRYLLLELESRLMDVEETMGKQQEVVHKQITAIQAIPKRRERVNIFLGILIVALLGLIFYTSCNTHTGLPQGELSLFRPYVYLNDDIKAAHPADILIYADQQIWRYDEPETLQRKLDLYNFVVLNHANTEYADIALYLSAKIRLQFLLYITAPAVDEWRQFDPDILDQAKDSLDNILQDFVYLSRKAHKQAMFDLVFLIVEDNKRLAGTILEDAINAYGNDDLFCELNRRLYRGVDVGRCDYLPTVRTFYGLVETRPSPEPFETFPLNKILPGYVLSAEHLIKNSDTPSVIRGQ